MILLAPCGQRLRTAAMPDIRTVPVTETAPPENMNLIEKREVKDRNNLVYGPPHDP